MIGRASLVDCREAFVKNWFPKVEASLLQATLLNKAKLVNYVLYAKHSDLDRKGDTLENMIEDFEHVVRWAKPFFTSTIVKHHHKHNLVKIE